MNSMETWADQGMVGFDLETTGVDPTTARIVTASLVAIRPHTRPVIHEWLADPGIEIPPAATDVHGITTDHARQHGQPHDDVLYEVIENLLVYIDQGVPLVVFNAPYDLTLIEWAAVADSIPPLSQRLDRAPGPSPLHVIDPLVLDRYADPLRRGKGVRKLTHLCQHVYDIALPDAHASSADALAACRVAWKIFHRYPDLARMTLPDLHAAQVGWYREQQYDLKAYMISQGRGGDFDGVWPFTPAPAPDGLFDAPPAPPAHGGLL